MNKRRINLSEVTKGDTVRVTPARRYGEEQETADYWDAPVEAIDLDNGMIGIASGNPNPSSPAIRWLSVRGSNPNGVDPACPRTRLLVQTHAPVRVFQPVYLADEPDALEEFRDRALDLNTRIRVATRKADRVEQSKDLAAVIRAMYAEAKDI